MWKARRLPELPAACCVRADGFGAGAGFAVAFALIAVPFDMVEVKTAVGEVAYGAFGTCPTEVRQIDVADGQRFDIFGGFSGYTVARKGEIARR